MFYIVLKRKVIMIAIYYDYKSYSSQKVLVYLFEKGIKWESRFIDLLKQEHLTDETYKYINVRLSLN